MIYQSAGPFDVRLLSGLSGTAPDIFYKHMKANRDFLVDFKIEDLLQNYYFEAGQSIKSNVHRIDGNPVFEHNGWEHPSSLVRGHFLGHWMSAAAWQWASTDDRMLFAMLNDVVDELDKLQRENGGEWIASIPMKYFYHMAEGRSVWAPHYVVHKTFMGLIDTYLYADNRRALMIAENFAKWFIKWTASMDKGQMDDILDNETGGMMEVWASLYKITGKEEYLDMMERYYRSRFFEQLANGRDPLTNRHANTTIPEAHGVAMAYEVTGDEKWLELAKTYWSCAITERGTFVTGGSTNEEMWQPPMMYAARLGKKTQEHCCQYNLIRLADYLYRATGDIEYIDFIEKNFYNSLLAQHNVERAAITYFLPLGPGSQKKWDDVKDYFWCCHGSMAQAHTRYVDFIYHMAKGQAIINQYIPSRGTLKVNGVQVNISQHFDTRMRNPQDSILYEYASSMPKSWRIHMKISTESPIEFTLRLRIPDWISDEAEVIINGVSWARCSKPGYLDVDLCWFNDRVVLDLPIAIKAVEIPDQPEMTAFRVGPIALAGITDHEQTLYGDKENPDSLLVSHDEGGRGNNDVLWHHWYKTRLQANNIIFKPLYEIDDEVYTVYFPIWKTDLPEPYKHYEDVETVETEPDEEIEDVE